MYVVFKILITLLFLSSLALNVYLLQKGGVRTNKLLSTPLTEIMQSTQSESLALDYDGGAIPHSVLEDRKTTLETYLIPTKTHAGDTNFFYDVKTDRIIYVSPTVGVNSVSMTIDYDEDKDNVLEQNEEFKFQLHPSIVNYALYKSDYTSPKQKFGFVGESFAIQKNGYQLVSINEDKVNRFYIDTNLSDTTYLPSFIAKMPVTEVTILKDHNIVTQFYFIGREGGGDDWGLHYLPICYDDSSSKLFVVKADGGAEVEQYLSVGWSKTDGGMDTISVVKNQISCLNQAYTTDDLYAQRN